MSGEMRAGVYRGSKCAPLEESLSKFRSPLRPGFAVLRLTRLHHWCLGQSVKLGVLTPHAAPPAARAPRRGHEAQTLPLGSGWIAGRRAVAWRESRNAAVPGGVRRRGWLRGLQAGAMLHGHHLKPETKKPCYFFGSKVSLCTGGERGIRTLDTA